MGKGIKTGYLIAALCVSLLFLISILALARSEENRFSDIQLSAAKAMEKAEDLLRTKAVERGLELQEEDLNGTFLIGPDFTELTTTMGNLEAKRTSLNPNFAAAMVRYYIKAGLREGDTVAIGSSGSFPGLAVAAVIAAKEYGLKTKVIASLGASTYGATRVDFNIFDILLSVKEGGFADFELLAVSRGGEKDHGEGAMEGLLFEGSQQLSFDVCKKVSEKTGAEFLVFESLSDNVDRRLELYGDIDMFVNIGGSAANSAGHSFPYGLVLKRQALPDVPVRGLCYEYSARGIPVLNLLNVKLLASENGIAFDSVPMQKPGEGGVYSETRYSLSLIMAGLVCTIAILFVGVLRSRRGRSIGAIVSIVLLLSLSLCSCRQDSAVSLESYEAMYEHLVRMWAQSVEAGDGVCDIAFYGDSRVAGANWNGAFPDHDVVNLGVGGDRVEQTLTRLSLLDAFQVKHCFLAIGGNDALSNSFDEEIFRSNYNRLLSELENRGITVYVNTIPGVTKAKATESRGNARKNGNIGRANTIIKELASTHGMTVIDLAELMNTAEGYLRDEYALPADGVHFSEEGNQCWFGVVRPYLEALEP